MGSCCHKTVSNTKFLQGSRTKSFPHSPENISPRTLEVRTKSPQENSSMSALTKEKLASKYEFAEKPHGENILATTQMIPVPESAPVVNQSYSGTEEDDMESHYPAKFIDLRNARRAVTVPKLDCPTVQTVTIKMLNPKSSSLIAKEQKPETNIREFSFTKKETEKEIHSPESHPDRREDELSESISNQSLASSSQRIKSPAVDTIEGRTLLSPVKVISGRSLLLRPLYSKREGLRSASRPMSHQSSQESAFSLARNSSLTTAQKVSKQTSAVSGRTLKGTTVYSLGPTLLDLPSSLGCLIRPGAAQNKVFLVCRYNKKKLKHMILGRGCTALSVLSQQLEVMSGASHPNVLRLHEVVHLQDYLYMVLESAVPSSLMSLVPLDEGLAWEVFTQMLSAVDYLHTELHCHHSDLRPSSFIVNGSGVVQMSWLRPVMRIDQKKPGSTGKDLFLLTGILFFLLLGRVGANEETFGSVMDLMRTEEGDRLIVSSTLSSHLQSFLQFCIRKQEQLTLSDIKTHVWVSRPET